MTKRFFKPGQKITLNELTDKLQKELDNIEKKSIPRKHGLVMEWEKRFVG